MEIQDFFKKWISTRPNLKSEFHDAGIEVMAFAEAYHNEQLRLHSVSNRRELLIDCVRTCLQDEESVTVEQQVDTYLHNKAINCY